MMLDALGLKIGKISSKGLKQAKQGLYAAQNAKKVVENNIKASNDLYDRIGGLYDNAWSTVHRNNGYWTKLIDAHSKSVKRVENAQKAVDKIKSDAYSKYFILGGGQIYPWVIKYLYKDKK